MSENEGMDVYIHRVAEPEAMIAAQRDRIANLELQKVRENEELIGLRLEVKALRARAAELSHIQAVNIARATERNYPIFVAAALLGTGGAVGGLIVQLWGGTTGG